MDAWILHQGLPLVLVIGEVAKTPNLGHLSGASDEGLEDADRLEAVLPDDGKERIRVERLESMNVLGFQGERDLQVHHEPHCTHVPRSVISFGGGAL